MGHQIVLIIWSRHFGNVDVRLLMLLRLNRQLKNFIMTLVVELPDDIERRCGDQQLRWFPYLRKLTASSNPKITSEGTKHLNHLHTLKASCNPRITDEGIKHMQLHTLNAGGTSGITNEGIKHMQLHTLDASYNPNITNEGIKHM